MKSIKKDKKFKKQTESLSIKPSFSPLEKLKEIAISNIILYILLAVIYIFYIGFYLHGDPIAKTALKWLFSWIIGGAVIVSIYDFLFDYFYFKNKKDGLIGSEK